ncbi:granulocyte-macrophage colony-stimulating factor receptor subunit alpha-like isoform X7 [Nannospalax galili]|uniref:granulocyte-macrophage colony-stimulating factor receptor subunit alpha-like isoform X7 n=1 Tax=Nannospalax galili TaxID=1026970 RepID=UPI00111BCEC1|nr:granulocyte-macrophage colony-stimulating factor receptor subunit alpha-like isoform X7 [Nannospalax galili]
MQRSRKACRGGGSDQLRPWGAGPPPHRTPLPQPRAPALPVRAVSPLVLCLVLLPPAFLGTPEPAAVTPQEPEPELNVTFNPRTWTLTWACRENVTVTMCIVTKAGGPRPSTKPRKDACGCTFRRLLLHQGLSLEVQATVNRTVIRQKLAYVNPGANGTAAQNLSCSIHLASVMMCTWEPGPVAPPDVQYYLYIKDLSERTEWECPQYLGDSVVHTGCRVQNLSGLPSESYVLLNGTSRREAIQFLDAMLDSKEIVESLQVKLQGDSPDRATQCTAQHHCDLQRIPLPRDMAEAADLGALVLLGLQVRAGHPATECGPRQEKSHDIFSYQLI